ncbi:methylmalonyl-CoA epimerase, mitochondrial-like [Uloborus diversus]|uniref:methylmalonyl-CoA epimerase, mitochondrial-like n=1 Tax=Uloborus diversus TaxID=327109 RepID=UPI002409B51E|nr:methylmalonyl-CoA epimerase, mitochondrial-like [Uloborus diversus]
MKLADKLHKIAVTGLMGLTAIGAITLGYQMVQYFTTMPARRKIRESQAAENTGSLIEMLSLFRSRILKMFKAVNLVADTACFHAGSLQKKSWNILRVNHLATATKDLDTSVKFYRDVLGAKTSQPVPLPEHGVTTVFVELSNVKLELLHPLGNKSPIESFLDKNPSGGMHHICLEVDNIENAVEDLKAKNIRLLGDKPRPGAHGKPVIFLHPKDCGGVLIELEEV